VIALYRETKGEEGWKMSRTNQNTKNKNEEVTSSLRASIICI
jgi:hypothetical protein